MTTVTKRRPSPWRAHPRALEAASGPFELAALLQKGELVIYLDRFETNDPITAALITVETPLGPVTAEAKEGTYRLAAPWAQVGSHDLIFTVTADDLTEILSGTLRVAPAAPETSKSGGWGILSPAVAQGLKERLGSSSTALVALIAFAAGLIAATLLRRAAAKRPLAVALFSLLLLAPGLTQAHEGHDGPEQRLASA